MSYREKEKIHRPPPTGGVAVGGGGSRSKDNTAHGVNPLFRGRRHAPEVASKKRVYPDPSLAIPYLQVDPPTKAEKQKEDRNANQRYGPSNTLLGQYWLANNYKLENMKDFDGRKPSA
ncbi:hypothetical protein BC941DRAFT_444582 [Chlamydoabsidia padenii]|nr:hypothetical protein BC941DRAFT_444582 [Chlamydoabsidia padenii]